MGVQFVFVFFYCLETKTSKEKKTVIQIGIHQKCFFKADCCASVRDLLQALVLESL